MYYLMKMDSFTAKSGKPCFTITLLYKKLFGWGLVDKFISKEDYDYLRSLPLGTPLTVDTDIDGHIKKGGISYDDRFPTLPEGIF